MLNQLIRTFLRLPILAVLLCAVLLIWGLRAYNETPKDALPDIAENQTIVSTEWMGRSPKDVDEQVTYPLTVALQGVPQVKEIRATSGFGWSIVYVVFDDDVDFYWARSRVLERLDVARANLPTGAIPTLGPDATALGQIYWYTVENGWYSPSRPGLRFNEDGTLTADSRNSLLQSHPDRAEQLDTAESFTCPISGEPLQFSRIPLDRLRSIQDFDVKLALESVEGVSEVASVGGYVRQYQVDVDPESLRAFGIPFAAVLNSIRNANIDVGARVVEDNGMEVLIRGVGFLGGDDRNSGDREKREQAVIRDIENIVLRSDAGTPVYIRQIANVTTGPDFRRGSLDKMGAEAVGGCVAMRFGENPLDTIDRIKQRIAAIEPGLPPGARINAFYDRSHLIGETLATLTTTLRLELIVTAIAAMLFLLHFRSSLVIAVTLPLAVMFAFICMRALKLPSNIMSLAGIAIAIGTMVDMSIVMLENIFQHLSAKRQEYTLPDGSLDYEKRTGVIREAASEVSSAILTAIATTVISFLPVFFLEGQSGRLFKPLAWTKTFCLVGAALLAIIVVPTLASIALREFRMNRRKAAVVAIPIAIVLTLIWYSAAGLLEVFAQVQHYCTTRLGFLEEITVFTIFFLVTFAVLREQVRPTDRNPVSRIILAAYEPVLRTLLRNKFIFLIIPIAIVLWGLSIWLGWADVLALPAHLAESIGLSPTLWTLGGIIAIPIGCIIGFLLYPLLWDTVCLLRKRKPQQLLLRNTSALIIAILVIIVLPRFLTADWAQAKPVADYLTQNTGIGQEFMPPLDEGDFLYMPSILPAGSINTAREVMEKQDIQFAQIPEVETVVGKLGRIDSALDPAPVGMLETVIALKPRDQWPLIDDPDHPGLQRKRTNNEIWDEIRAAGRFPGVLPSVQLQPIRTRVEMLSTGLNAKIGIKVYGNSLEGCEQLAVNIEQLLRDELSNAEAINAIRTNGKPYLEIDINRKSIARYGVNIRDVQDVIEAGIGGRTLTETLEGLDRYPVRVRFQRELRDNPERIAKLPVPTADGAYIPLQQIADVHSVIGPMSVRREGARFVTYVTMNNTGVDETTLVNNGKAIIDQAIIDGRLQIPEGYHLRWTGSYERNLRAKQRLSLLIPLVLLINFVLIYLQFGRMTLAATVFLAIPVAFSGGFILLEYWPALQDMLYVSGFIDRGFEGDAMYLTVAVWVGFIALFGIAVDDGIVMGTYLDQTFRRSPIRDYREIENRVVEAGLRRIRPCLMTSFTTLAALVPVLLSTGRGSDVMTPMALPVFGGMLVVLITIFVTPVCYCAVEQLKWKLKH